MITGPVPGGSETLCGTSTHGPLQTLSEVEKHEEQKNGRINDVFTAAW